MRRFAPLLAPLVLSCSGPPGPVAPDPVATDSTTPGAVGVPAGLDGPTALAVERTGLPAPRPWVSERPDLDRLWPPLPALSLVTSWVDGPPAACCRSAVYDAPALRVWNGHLQPALAALGVEEPPLPAVDAEIVIDRGEWRLHLRPLPEAPPLPPAELSEVWVCLADCPLPDRNTLEHLARGTPLAPVLRALDRAGLAPSLIGLEWRALFHPDGFERTLRLSTVATRAEQERLLGGLVELELADWTDDHRCQLDAVDPDLSVISYPPRDRDNLVEFQARTRLP